MDHLQKNHVYNLVTLDSQQVERALPLFHLIWTGPTAIIIAIVLLYTNLGPSSLAGFAFLFVAMTLLALAAGRLASLKRILDGFMRSRVRLSSEVFSKLRAVSLLGWEPHFVTRLNEKREEELKWLRMCLFWRNIIVASSLVRTAVKYRCIVRTNPIL
jgi:hypothetical protein